MIRNLLLAGAVALTPVSSVPQVEEDFIKVWRTGASDDDIYTNNYRIECGTGTTPVEDVSLHMYVWVDTSQTGFVPETSLTDEQLAIRANPDITGTKEYSYTIVTSPFDCLTYDAKVRLNMPEYMESVCIYKKEVRGKCANYLTYWTEFLTFLPTIVARFLDCAICNGQK